MNNYCIMSLKKIKSMFALKECYRHNFREMPLKHVDVSKIEENEELIDESGCDYIELWHRRVKDEELKRGESVSVRKNAVLAIEILTTFSKEMSDTIDMEAWKEANIKWMKETFGEENVISMQLHEDESVPHIHTIVVPIDERGKLCARSFVNGRAKMFGLQNSYAKAMEPVGLKRGEQYSKSKKSDINRFYAHLNKAAEKEAPKMNAGESVDSYIQRVNQYVQDEAIKSFGRERKLQRDLDIEKTRHEQWKAKYCEAIHLQDDLEEIFNGNREMVKKRLRTYREMEKAVPRVTLNSTFESILEKFNIFENVRKLKEREKRRKKKGEVDNTEAR